MSEERIIKQKIPLPKMYSSPEMKVDGIPVEKWNETEFKETAEQRVCTKYPDSRHKFQPDMNMLQSVSGVGDVSVRAVKQRVESADENYEAGVQEGKRYIHPAMELAAIGGAKSLAKGIQAELNQIAIISGQVHDLIMGGKLSMVDLGKKELLDERLEQLDGLTAFQKKQISKFRESAYDLMVIRDAIEKQRSVVDSLEEPLKTHLKSKEFFDLERQKTNELLKVYFKNSKNDVLKKVNPAGMSEKNIIKLLKTKDRNGFTETDLSALRLAGRQMKYREARIRIGRVVNIKKRIEMLGTYSGRMDDTAGSGISQIVYSVQLVHATFAVGKFGLKAGVVSASFAAKYSGAAYLVHKLNQKRLEDAEQLKAKVAETMKGSKTYQTVQGKVEAVKSRTAETKEKLDRKLKENTVVQKYKAAQARVKEKAKTAGKKVSQTKAAAKAAGREVRQGVDLILSPARFAGKVFHSVSTFFGKIRLVLLAGAGIIIGVFLIIIVLTNALLSIFQTETDMVVSVILTEEEYFVADMTAALQEKVEEKRQGAMELATGSPQNPIVCGGRAITRYGYPDANDYWTSGSKIVYLDGNGNMILNGRNNIKDCIVMAYIMMDGDFDSDRAARDDLIIDLWELMNPDVTYQESEIYTCPYGCDNFSYSCDSWDDYSTMDSYKADGVGFYGNIERYSDYGDGYTVICNGCKNEKKQTIYHDIQTGTGAAEAAEGCENYNVSYECTGHSVTVCYGHKDLEVYVKTFFMEEMFVNGRLPVAAGASYAAYLEVFQGWTEENREWAKLLMDGDWIELYGIDPAREN